MSKENEKVYCDNWGKDSKKIDDAGLYDWMESLIHEYKNVLEIGCGCGYSTVKLIEKGHNVICIEAASENIKRTQDKIEKKFNKKVKMINERVTETNCDVIAKKLSNEKIDLVICWNPGGTAMYSLEKVREIAYQFMLNGYRLEEKWEDFFNDYAEDMIRCALKLGNFFNADVNIVDRDCEIKNNFGIRNDDVKKEFYMNVKKVSEESGPFCENTMSSYSPNVNNNKMYYNSFIAYNIR